MSDIKTYHFGSLSEFADYCETAPRRWSIAHSDDRAAAWAGTNDLRQAIDFARNGQWKCPDMDLLRGVVDMPASREFEQSLEWAQDVVGVRPNVPAYLAGAPCNMWAPIYTDSERKIVRVLINRSYHSSVSAGAAVQHGALVLELMNKLETEHNITTELTVIVPYQVPGIELMEHTCTIKRAGQPLDLSEVAFAIACPAYLRRLMFKFNEALPAEHETEGYGSPREPSKTTLAEYDVYLPSPNCGLGPVKDAIKKAMTDGSIIRARAEEQT